MKILNVNTIVIKDNYKIKRATKSFNTDEPYNAGYVKDLIKSDLALPFEIIKEEFYYMSKELKDSDMVPFMSGNELILTVK